MYLFHGFNGPFDPNFTVCKKEGGPTVCLPEYVKEFSGYSRQRRPGYLGDLSDTWFGNNGGPEGPTVDKYYIPDEDTSDADEAYRSGVAFRRTIY